MPRASRYSLRLFACMIARTAASSRASARRTRSASLVPGVTTFGAMFGFWAWRMMVSPITGYGGWMRQGQIGSRKNKGFQGWVRRNHNPTISVKKSVGYAALTYPAILPSRPRRHLIEEPGDAADPAVAEHGEIRAFDRAVGAVGTEAPGEADVIAKAVGLADQLEF